VTTGGTKPPSLHHTSLLPSPLSVAPSSGPDVRGTAGGMLPDLPPPPKGWRGFGVFSRVEAAGYTLPRGTISSKTRKTELSQSDLPAHPESQPPSLLHPWGNAYFSTWDRTCSLRLMALTRSPHRTGEGRAQLWQPSARRQRGFLRNGICPPLRRSHQRCFFRNWHHKNISH